MPLTKAQCTNCGGTLEVDSSKDAAVCPFCNTPYIVEKAINLYKTENHIVNNVTYNGDGVVPEQKIKNAWILINDGHIDAAMKLLDEYSRINPNDYRVWVGYYFCKNRWSKSDLNNAANKSSPELKEKLILQLNIINEIEMKTNEINQLRLRNERMKRSGNEIVLALAFVVPFGLIAMVITLIGFISEPSSKSLMTMLCGFLFGLICICPSIFYSIYRHKKLGDPYKKAVSETNNVESYHRNLMSEKLSNDASLIEYVMQSFTI